MANIIGLNDLNKHLVTFKHITKIEVCEKETSKRAMFISTKDTGQPVADLNAFLETQQNYNTKQFLPFYIKLFMKKDGAPGSYGSDPVGFSFSFEQRDVNLSVNGPGAFPPSPFNQSQLFDIYRNNGYLEAENKRLSELLNSRDVKILELETELNSDDDDDAAAISGNDEFKNIVDIIGQVKDLIPSLFSGPPAIGGGSPAIQDLELNNIIAELNLIDPLFKKHMNEYLVNYKASQKNGTGNN
jgi:hypothetical protein